MGNTQVGDLVEIWTNTSGPAGIGVVVAHEQEHPLLGNKKYATVSWVSDVEPWERHVTRFKEHFLKREKLTCQKYSRRKN